MIRELGAAAVALATASCGTSAIGAATNVANTAHSALSAAAQVLPAECVDTYRAAKTEARIAELDARCLPLRDAYRAARLSHATLVAAIGAASASGDTAEVVARAQDLAFAVQRLGRVLAAIGAAAERQP